MLLVLEGDAACRANSGASEIVLKINFLLKTFYCNRRIYGLVPSGGISSQTPSIRGDLCA